MLSGWLEDVVRDVSFGLRTLRRNPGFTAAAFLSLALGIGANTGIFTLVDQLLLRPLPGVRHPEQLVLLDWKGSAFAATWGSGNLLSYPACRDLQAQTQFFDGVFCRHPTVVNFSAGRQHDPVRADIVSGSYFEVLGVNPERGRLIGPSDDRQPGAHPVVVLSSRYWRSSLGADPNIVGRSVLVNNHPMTVIGIAPVGFAGVDVGDAPSLWIPAMMKRQATPEWDRLFDRRALWMHVFGRLKPDVTAAQARAGLQPWFKATLEEDARQESLARLTPDQRRNFLASTLDVEAAAGGRSDLRGSLTRPLWVLMGGTVLLLLLACLNVAGLFLARGMARTRELTTRMALGASRWRITRQLLVESLLITLGGGVLGLLTAPIVARALLSFLPDDASLAARIDPRVFFFALLVSVAAGVVCGLVPAWQMRRVPLTDRPQVGATGGVRFRKMLVIGQLGFAVVLLTLAGLFAETVTKLYAKAPDAASRLVMFRADPPAIGYAGARARQFMRDLHARLRSLPAIEHAALANSSLLTGGSFSRVLTIRASAPVVTDRPIYGLRVTPDFFAAVGARMIAGRDFDERDTRPPDDETGYRSAIVNESFARRYFGNRDPIGHRLAIGDRPGAPATIEIVGVVEDFSYRSLRLADSEHVFFPFWDLQSEDGTVYLGVRGQPSAAFASIRAAVAELNPSLPVALTTFEDQIARSLTVERALALLSTGFGGVALVISVVGLYGVIAFVAARRTQEIGVRLALGATRSSAVWPIVRDALIVVAAGTMVGVAGAWMLQHVIQRELFGVAAFDASTIAAASGGLALVALCASALPAWRAAALPPMLALRDQPESIWQTARVSVTRKIHELTAHREVAPSLTLVSDLTAHVHRAASFPQAIDAALTALQERAGARFALLLELGPEGDAYQHERCTIPARGVLANRLARYPHPLPLSGADLSAWLRWARESRPQYVAEIERLEAIGVRMAVPLRTKQGVIGVLLLGPPAEREEFTGAQQQVVAGAAEVFALLLENARLNVRELKQEKIRRDLALAAEVQKRLLPREIPTPPAITLAAFTLPARVVGGDFYDFFTLPGDDLGFALADIAGKGVPAALLTAMVQGSLRVIATEHDIATSKLAARMNHFVYRSTEGRGYATFFYAVFDGDGRRLRYVNAGHNPPYVVRRNGSDVQIVELGACGTVIGLFTDVEYEDAEIALCPGDLLVAYTDGLVEARNPAGDEFGEDRLRDVLRGAIGASPAEVVSLLAEEVRTWIASAEQHDDVTFVVATVNTSAR
jgi:predicted permease